MVRYAFRCGGLSWETKETSLPGATYAGIIERLELISVPLIAEPQGAMCDGATSGFWYESGHDQSVSLSWYYPPEEWKPLAGRSALGMKLPRERRGKATDQSTSRVA